MKKGIRTALRVLVNILTYIMAGVKPDLTAQKRRSCAAYEDAFCDGADCARCTPLEKWETPKVNTQSPNTTHP